MAGHCPACGTSSFSTEPFGPEMPVCSRCAQILYPSEMVGRIRGWLTRNLHVQWPHAR